MKIARWVLRLTVGALFFGHGTQKLFGWFGGHGLEATAQGFEALGMHPGKRNAIAAGVAEAGGGALLASGAATPVAAAALTATMITAIARVHAKNGPWAGNGGYEYNLVLIAAVLTLAEASGKRPGWHKAAAALLGGAAGALGAHLAAEAAAPAAAQDPAPEAEAQAQEAGEQVAQTG